MELKGRYSKDCIIFTDNIESEALSMVYSFVNHPMFKDAKIRIMPDVHAGKDIVVGFTSPFTDHVNPDHVGGDIGCTVSTSLTDIPVNPDNFAEIEATIRESVKFGLTIHGSTIFPVKEFLAHLRRRHIEAQRAWPEYVAQFDFSENGLTRMLKRMDMNEATFYRAIGTVGSGNHFIEIGETPEGNYAITAHCGSRNFGQKVWKYWHMVSHNPSLVTTTGYLEGEQMRGYITDMVIAQAYAEYNHIMIQRLILDAIRRISAVSGKIVEQIITTHNYIDFDMRMIRKGAVRAAEGQKLVIPFNMRDGLIIARGKGNPDWNCSAPHGAGRLLKRSEAKELIDMDEYKESMKGIYTTSVGRSTLDESPMAYKDPKEILKLIEPTVEVLYFIRPVINMKDRGMGVSNTAAENPEQEADD
ncbi:MAG: RtcB family protein [Prevotellaceae bacterium]|nr:RtcB family protein [Prevotellaceae bacterium]